MIISWLAIAMILCWCLTLLGGIGSQVLSNFDGRKLEALCRLKRRPEFFGVILDRYDSAAVAMQYVLHFGLVLGSLAAGACFEHWGEEALADPNQSTGLAWLKTVSWVIGWLFLLTLAGLLLPRILVRDSSSIFLYHTWPIWQSLLVITRPITGLGDVFAWLGHRLTDSAEEPESEEEMLEDEIRTIVAAGQRDGVFSASVQGMIQGVMELNDSVVEKIMTTRNEVDAIDANLPWDRLVQQVVDCGRTRIPVYRDQFDNVIGVLFVKDLLGGLTSPQSTAPDSKTPPQGLSYDRSEVIDQAAVDRAAVAPETLAAGPLNSGPLNSGPLNSGALNSGALNSGALASAPPHSGALQSESADIEKFLRKAWFIPTNRPVDEVLQMFLHNRNHMAIVIDDYRRVAGVVTIEDALEEIVGEIADELDLEEDSDIYYDEKTHRVEADGKVMVERISEILGVDLPISDDYDTIGGLIIQRLSEIPKVGTQVETGELRITVLKATKRMIQRVQIEIIPRPEPA
ncbi:MAG TPA: hypothetical protein DDW52_23280 [Planctomycetaceae bacterium]|nr:hypothetical protein [Planctomycetaceae bacterium]